MSIERDKLKAILSKRKSSWLQDAIWRKENDFWLETSQQIAIRILFELNNRGMSQVELAGRLGMYPQQVNKIVKGAENLTLETIRKIEMALSVRLISVVESGVAFQEQSIDVISEQTRQYAEIAEKLRKLKKVSIRYEVVKVISSPRATAKILVKAASHYNQYETAA